MACSWVKPCGHGFQDRGSESITYGPLMWGTAICGEEALAFGAVRGEGFEYESASCVVPVCV